MSEEELKKTIDIVAGIEVHSETEATAKEELISYVEQLQQENYILKQAIDNTYETSQDIMYEMQEENESLGKSVNKASQLLRKKENKIKELNTILIEFEKWLGNKLETTYANNDMAKGYKNALSISLDKLQNLKEGKK